MRSRIGLIGWLYADLVLALFVIFLAVAGQPSPAAPRPSPGPSPTIPATPSPTPSCAASVPLVKQTLSPVPPRAGSNPPLPDPETLRAEFAYYKPKVAGIVLTFVHSSNVNDGDSLAGQVNVLLRQADPDMFRPEGQTIYEAFFHQDLDASHHGDVEFYVYFLNPPCQ